MKDTNIIIPDFIMRDRHLRAGAKLVYGFIYGHQPDNGKPINIDKASVGETLAITRTAVSQALKVLIKNGWIVDHGAKGQQNRPYRALMIRKDV